MIKKVITIALVSYVVLFGAAVLFQRFILLHPQKLAKDYIYEFKGAEEFYIEANPTVNLNALIFRTKDTVSKGVVMYLHGNSDNLVRWGKHAEEFNKRGYDVIMYDYRGFGKSDGRLDEKNLLEDAQLVLVDIGRRYPLRNIIIYGRSLGSGVATKLASENLVKMLILETPYYSITDLAWSQLPLFPYKRVSEFDIPTYEWIPKVKCPIHIFHGTDDRIVPYSQSIKLVEVLKKKPNDILTTLEGGHHRDLDHFKEYQNVMDKLLK